MTNRFSNWISQFDEYGPPISFNFRGQEQNKTVIGGLFNIIITGTVFIYALGKGRQLVFRENANTTSFTKITSHEDTKKELYFKENQFQLAVGFVDKNKNDKAVRMPRSIG